MGDGRRGPFRPAQQLWECCPVLGVGWGDEGGDLDAGAVDEQVALEPQLFDTL
jgi:hypothetical protein